MKNSFPVIYVNDKRRPVPVLLDLLIFHIKEIIKLFFNRVIIKKTKEAYIEHVNELNQFKGKINTTKEKNHYDVPLFVLYEAFSDYDIQSSRHSLLFRNISSDNPVSILSSSYPLKSNRIIFSLFLHKQIKWAKSINIKGYIDHSKKEYFDIDISKNIKDELSKTSYWLDVILDLNGFDIAKSVRKIGIYLTQVKFDREIDHEVLFPYHIISPDIPKVSGSQRPVFILSFDGITTEDIFDANEMCGSIRSFADDNFLFNNAVTSSAVTASSAASLMTGFNLAKHFLYIYKKNYLAPNMKILSRNIKTLGEKVRSVGMHSYGLFAFGKWSPQYGYARGFSEYRCITGGDQTKYPWLDESIKTIMKNIENPHMFAMHHPGGHSPFLPVVTTPYFDQEYSFYHKNLAYVDMFFENIIHYLKINNLYDSALIIFMSDHGRSLSGLKKTEYHFKDDRLRIPLVIKNPDWNDNSLNGYNLNSHISAQTMVHEIVLQFLGIPLSRNRDFDYRTVDGITWVSETVDYRRMNWHGDMKEGYIGLVGYDAEFKYTLYYNVDFELFYVKESSDLLRYQLTNSRIAEGNGHIISNSENKRITNSGFEYLKSGISFAKMNPPEALGDRTAMFNI